MAATVGWQGIQFVVPALAIPVASSFQGAGLELGGGVSELDAGPTEQNSLSISASTSASAPVNLTLGASGSLQSRGRGQKRGREETNERRPKKWKRNNYYSEILKQLAQLRQETREIKQGMEELMAQVSTLVEQRRSNSRMEPSFFSLLNFPNSLSLLHSPLVWEQAEIDEEVVRPSGLQPGCHSPHF